MKEPTKQDIEKVLSGILTRSQNELYSKTKDQLEEYWYFVYNPEQSIDNNTYEFHKMLNLYSRKCRSWEEHHNGNCCVVERVRDQYIMPKIREFLKTIEYFTPR